MKSKKRDEFNGAMVAVNGLPERTNLGSYLDILESTSWRKPRNALKAAIGGTVFLE